MSWTLAPFFARLSKRMPFRARWWSRIYHERQFSLLSDSARDYAIFFMDGDGAIRTWPAPAETMFGYTASEILGSSYRKLLAEMKSEVEAVADLTIASGHGRYEDTIQMARKGGNPFWAEYVICPIYNPNGDVHGFSNVIRDISERKKAQELLRQKEEALQQALKMDAIGRLAGGVAHDFNNLITGIIGLSQDVHDELPETDVKREDLKEIIRASNRAAALTRQLLAFARRDALSPQQINLNETISDIYRMLRRSVGTGIEVKLELAAEPCFLVADPGHMEQILLNLVLNARDAISSKGLITIRTKCVSTEPADHKFVRLEVEDTGKGIDKETRRHLFEPFFTTKPKGQGTGLGLATVYGIVKQNHGQISVDSALGKGSCFAIQFPFNASMPILPAPGPLESVGPRQSRGETILLVDDDEIVRKSVERTLRKTGYRVIEAAEGKNALEIFRSDHASIDLLLSDVVMPRMNGVELAESVRRIRPNIKVLFMSGYADEILNQSTLISGDYAFIEKSFAPEALLQKIRQLLPRPSAEKVGS
jgi:two-component system cell cycle sensor histidine kinase/response regulator CckA